MTHVTLSLSEEAIKKLRKIAKENMRSMSKQVEYLIMRSKRYRSST